LPNVILRSGTYPAESRTRDLTITNPMYYLASHHAVVVLEYFYESLSWQRVIGDYLDILAVSCDSFDADTNRLIGRQQGSRDHLDSVHRVRDLCTKYKVCFGQDMGSVTASGYSNVVMTASKWRHNADE